MRDAGRRHWRLGLAASRLLTERERAEWFDPSREDALAVHVRKVKRTGAGRWLREAAFEGLTVLLVLECLRLRWAGHVRVVPNRLRASARAMLGRKGAWSVSLWIREARFAWRGLRKRPGFSTVVVLTLALGIGANTAIFSVVNAVLLRALPYADAERLVVLWGDNTVARSTRDPHSPHTYDDYVRDWPAADRVEGITPRWNFTIVDGEPERVNGYYASAGFLGMLGVEPALGRGFDAADDRAEVEKVVLISHALWQRRYGGAQDVIGRALRMSDATATIVGVLPAGFQWREGADLWVPLRQNSYYTSGERRVRLFEIVARLRPDVTLAQANATARDVAANLARAYPAEMNGIGARVVSLREDVVGPVRPALVTLLAAVALVLLIACANVANLMLLRFDGRRRDAAVRVALGATRSRLAGELMAESTLLSLLGGGAGFVLAQWGVRALLAFTPADLPRRHEIALDWTVLLFTLGLSLLTALLFGLAPLLETLRGKAGATLRDGARTSGGTRSGLRRLLVSSETALAVVVATAAMLLVRSYAKLNAVDPGFTVENVLSIDLSGLPADPQARVVMTTRLHEALRAAPGVLSTGEVSRLPFGGATNVTTKLDKERHPLTADEQPEVDLRRASASYFEVMNIARLAGRLFEPMDGAAGESVVVINQVLADRYFAGEDPLGQRVSLGGGALSTIIGVVGATRFASPAETPRPEVYLSTHRNALAAPQIVIRTRGEPEALAAAVRSAIRSVEPALVLGRMATLEDLRHATLSGPRFNTLLFGLFAGLALLLSTLGAWGVMSYSVAQRRREIGVRVSLGARPAQVAGMILREGMFVTGGGIAVGLLAALAGTQLMSNMLFGVSPSDAGTFGLVTLVVGSAVLCAALASARRAMRVDPVRALGGDA
jgi:predicted permease